MIARQTQVAIQVGRRKLGLDDDTYRAMLKRIAKVTSSTELDQAGADRVLAEMRAKGFDPAVKRRRRGVADKPMARLARAWWLNLWNLDELEDGSEAALNAFAKGITGKEALQFCSGPELNKVVEGLKAWCSRIGLSPKGNAMDLRRNLCREQWARLFKKGWARVEGDWGLGPFGFSYACTPNQRSFENFDKDHLDKLARELGKICRGQKVGRRHHQEEKANG